jgi:hypothetical protein
MMPTYLSIGAIVASLIAALLGIRAATVKVHDNIDRFIADLHRQGRWAACAALAAAIATVLQIVGQYLGK